MKKLATVVLRFLVVFFIGEAGLSALWMVDAIARGGITEFGPALYSISVAVLPGAIVAAVFAGFFVMNRVFSSRIIGFIVMTGLASFVIAASASIPRYLYTAPLGTPSYLPAAYRLIATWVISLPSSPLPEAIGAIVSFSAFITGFWGCTRLSQTRPLIGAFAAPGCALAALYIVSIFASGPADAVFAYIGLGVSRLTSTTILLTIGALTLLMADALLARKPLGGAKNAR
ncbi:MAG: hypothetical protein JXM71_08295 [Spirochaetales bacterium]|nr:hypothetical protein [Spirochaetales bacterium]